MLTDVLAIRPTARCILHVRLEAHVLDGVRHLIAGQQAALQLHGRLLAGQIDADAQHSRLAADLLLNVAHTTLTGHAVDVNADRAAAAAGRRLWLSHLGLRHIRTLEAHVVDVAGNRAHIGQPAVEVNVAGVLGQHHVDAMDAQLGGDRRLDALHARLAGHADNGQPDAGQRLRRRGGRRRGVALVQQAVRFADIVRMEAARVFGVKSNVNALWLSIDTLCTRSQCAGTCIRAAMPLITSVNTRWKYVCTLER